METLIYLEVTDLSHVSEKMFYTLPFHYDIFLRKIDFLFNILSRIFCF